jgi:hypothetical protein
MHRLILPAVFVLLMSACSTYQYMTVDSPQMKKDDHSPLTFENDTLKMTYRISGKGGPVELDIYNKTNQPLYVNWKKSAFIHNDLTTSLFNNNITMIGRPPIAAYRTGQITPTEGRYASGLSVPEGIDFIPPASGISKALPNLSRLGILETDLLDTLPQKKLIAADGLNYTRYRQRTYGEDQSPVRFRCYITFSIGSNNGQEFAETNSFYVGEICQTTSAPDFFALYRQQGDQFYITTSSNIR